MTLGLASKVQASSRAFNRSWLQWSASLRGNGLPQKYSGDEPPLRSELFSADQMKQHGKTLAASHQLSPGRRSRPASHAAGRERRRPDRSLRAC